MIIKFDEVLSRKSALHKELMVSLTGDVIIAASEKRSYDVKLLVDGVELEPALLNDVMSDIESYIEERANDIVAERFLKVKDKIRTLEELIDKAIDSVSE